MDYALGMAKGFAPAAERNRDPILNVLRRVLPPSGIVLEIASGTGQHSAFFSKHLPSLRWQPSDMTADTLASIHAWVEAESRANLLAPIELDVRQAAWPIEEVNAVLCINMIHISPWETRWPPYHTTSAMAA